MQLSPSQGQDTIVTLGQINGVFGVKGWVKVYSYTAQQDAIFGYKPWYLLQGQYWQKVELIAGQRQGKGLIALIDGYDTRDAALALRNTLVGAKRSCLPQLSEGEFYWSDLIGLSVKTIDGQVLGKIDSLVETGANDVMVVKGQREHWIPWVMYDVVKSVDLVGGLVEVDWDADF